MVNLFSSLTDPIFWLHHANMDRVWWSWQALDLPARLNDVAAPMGKSGGKNLTLEYELKMGKMGRTIEVKDIMNGAGWPWCIQYEKLYTPAEFPVPMGVNLTGP
jgi:tyrosinase